MEICIVIVSTIHLENGCFRLVKLVNVRHIELMSLVHCAIAPPVPGAARV